MRILFLDIEVSPNIVFSWATGYKLMIPYDNIIDERAIICICYKFEGDSEVSSLQWSKKSDKKMLEKFAKIAQDADVMVGHNGDRFDIKWIRTRCLYHRIPFPYGMKTIDTLKKARGQFYFNSNRLDYIGKYIGKEGKADAGGFDTWRKIVLDNDKEALKTMVDYCKQDVLLLEEVYSLMQEYFKPEWHKGVINGLKRYTCPCCGGSDLILKQARVSGAGIKTKRMLCKRCNHTFGIAWSTFMKYLSDKEQGLIE